MSTTTAIPPIIYVIEDDASSRLATARVLKAAGFTVQLFESATVFLAALPTGPGCIVWTSISSD
jgi:FixJ family two-component response regulator